MTSWLCITTRDNWEIIKNKKIWAVSKHPDTRHERIIGNVKIGDKLLIYASMSRIDDKIIPSAIMGEFEATSMVYSDSSPLFPAPAHVPNEVYPFRIKLRPTESIKKPIEFKELVPKLGFIKNKKNYAGHIHGKSMIKLSDEDYQTILKDN